MIDPNEFNKLFKDLVKVKKPVDTTYKVYYNKETGKVLQFTTDTLVGDYIKITKAQYAESRYSNVVINGKLVSLDTAERYSKLVRSVEGTACAKDNIMIIDPTSSIRWKLKTYEE